MPEIKEKFNFLLNSDVFSHLITLKYLPRWVVLLFDIFLCLISYYIAYYISLKLYNNTPDVRILSVFQRVGLIVGFQIVFFGSHL